MLLRRRWTIHVWTIVSGNTAVIASGKALKAVDDGKQDIVDTAVLELVKSGSPRSMLRGVA